MYEKWQNLEFDTFPLKVSHGFFSNNTRTMVVCDQTMLCEGADKSNDQMRKHFCRLSFKTSYFAVEYV